MIEKELLMKKAKEGYTVCYEELCPLREHCIRWQVGQHVPSTACAYTCVNPDFKGVGTTECTMYRKDQKVRFAKGMMHIFNEDMPKRVQDAVKYGVMSKTNRTYYYEYKNGSRLIPPALQDDIRKLFRSNGWSDEVHFDGYIDNYDW